MLHLRRCGCDDVKRKLFVWGECVSSKCDASRAMKSFLFFRRWQRVTTFGNLGNQQHLRAIQVLSFYSLTMDINLIQRTGPLQGFTLNIEEVAGLEVGMLQRKLQENLPGKFLFWGKIFGSTQDYLVVYHVSPYDEFPDKSFYYW